MRPILLDTCALIWIVEDEPLRAGAREQLESAEAIFVSPISAWELGLLVSRGRMKLTQEPRVWFERALATGLDLAPMPPEVLVASSFLPSTLLRDPADKIMAATARTFQYVLLTRDRPLLTFAQEGHIEAIAC